jgi:hypothetical protein
VTPVIRNPYENTSREACESFYYEDFNTLNLIVLRIQYLTLILLFLSLNYCYCSVRTSIRNSDLKMILDAQRTRSFTIKYLLLSLPCLQLVVLRTFKSNPSI